MKPGWMAGMGLAAAAATATCRTLDCAPRLTAWLENAALADRTALGIAQGTATRIFATAGVKLVWRIGSPAANPGCGFHVALVLDEAAPAKFAREAMGYATVGEIGATVHIFYKRVFLAYNRALAPVVLGHVFAHEMVHAIENMSRHSQTGVLKARWTSDDLDEMSLRPLPLAAIDAELVRYRLGL
jgi:hypothetical protein